MSSRNWRDRVEDILAAIAEIQSFTSSMELSDFQDDIRTMKAVELNFIVIGEAANHISREMQAQHTDVPWQQMRAMRNRLVHVYFKLDASMVWETVQNDLPSLVEPLRRLLVESQD